MGVNGAAVLWQSQTSRVWVLLASVNIKLLTILLLSCDGDPQPARPWSGEKPALPA